MDALQSLSLHWHIDEQRILWAQLRLLSHPASPHASAYAELQATKLNGERSFSGNFPAEGVLSAAGGDPIVAAVVGVRILPPAALAGANEPGESPTSAPVLGKMPMLADGRRPEGGGWQASEVILGVSTYARTCVARNATVGRTVGLYAFGSDALVHR